MKSHAKILALLALTAMAHGMFAADGQTRLEEFSFQGNSFVLEGDFAPGQADVYLRRDRDRQRLSDGMKGENLLLGTRAGNGNFYVFWLNYRQRSVRLAYYDHLRRRSRLLPWEGFSALGLPEVIERDGRPVALLFLGNRSNNDDLFHYELDSRTLSALTSTPYCEKGFTWRQTAAGLEFETTHLGGRCRYRYDAASRLSTLLAEERPTPPRRRHAVAAGPEYYNTFVGFGDSITWGQIEGVQRLDLCYLTQMRDFKLALDYGPSDFFNLGVPGDGTLQGAERVDTDLSGLPAFYFLLMLGVNDVIHADFSLASSLENIAYIMDAALARGMRVIVSTLTPRKDERAQTQWYWNNLYSLSAGILGLAAQKGTASIDSLAAFMASQPPDGWKDLLETPGTVIIDGQEVVIKGNHPNNEGHALIASLFSAALIDFPPLPPANIKVLNPSSAVVRTATWDACPESDFDHFHIEFGFKTGERPYAFNTGASYYSFWLFPFLPTLDFRIQTVDRAGRTSDFRAPGGMAAGARRSPFAE